MAKEDNENLFHQLTKLFRSGPVIKRKVRGYKKTSNSTANQVFKKSLSQVYSTAMSAYGTYDRMSRYSDYSEMEYCLAGDTLIAVPGGYETIETLANKYKDDEFIVYAYDHNKKQIVPALAKQPRKTREDHAFKVTFDSGKELIGTANHRLMLRDGSFRRIDELSVGDSMMPFYRKDLFAKDNDKEKYLWIYTMTPETRNGWITEHKLIAEWSQRKLLENEVVHHVDVNPSQRTDITFGRILELCEREGFNSAKICKVLDTDVNTIKRRLRENGFDDFETFALAYNKDWKNSGWDNHGSKNPRYDSSLTFQKICDAFDAGMTLDSVSSKLDTTPAKIINRVKAAGYKNYTDFKSNYVNHKVVSVEYYGLIPLYDLTVDGYKNFATDSVISHNTPEISSALDIYSEETVANDDKGRVLQIYSENRQIQRLLEELFYDTLNVEFNLTPWARDLVKYGDFFLFNDVSPEYGVLNVFPVPVNEMEREEGFDPNDPMAVRFRWVTQGNQVLENWQITHFRLLGNDAFLPYGSSVLESARRIWRQLILIEDAMLVYRVVRSPERRVFYVDVGNVPPEDVPNYMEQAKSILRSNQVIDSQSGRVDLRYNPLPIWSETPIPLLDGRTITIRELAEEFETGKENWVYSIQDDTHKIVPGKIVWCGKNYTADEIIRVRLDDDTFIDVAPEHPFILRDGSSVRADELVPGQPLMPFYRKLSNKEEGDYVSDYEKVYDPGTSKFRYTHKLISSDFCIDQDREVDHATIHHINHCKWDNTPENLQKMTWWEHKDLHANANQTEAHRNLVRRTNKKYRKAEKMGAAYNGSSLHKEHNEIRSATQHKIWNDEEKREQRCANMRWQIPAPVLKYVFDRVKEAPRITRAQLTREIRESDVLIKALTEANSKNKRDVTKFNVSSVIGKFRREGVCNGWTDLRETIVKNEIAYRNHTVLSVETVSKKADVFCMTVVGPDGEDDRHNFALLSISDNSARGFNSLKEAVTSPHLSEDETLHIKNSNQTHIRRILTSGVFVKNSVDEDYFIPTRGGDGGSKIETLAGGTNVTAIEDVEYIQKKLFAALKIPKAYLGYDESLGSKATLSQEDIRFSRTINRIQRTVLSELNKLAIIHLFSNGFEGDDLLDFELNLCNPSTVAQQQKLEIYRTRLEIAGSSPEGLVDRQWIRKNIMNFTDDEIDRIERGRIEDKETDLRIEGIAQEVSGDEEDFGGTGGFGGGAGGVGGGDFGDEEAGEEGEAGEAGEEGDDDAGEDEEIDDDLFASQERSTFLTSFDEIDIIDEDEDEDDNENFTYSINDEDAPIKAQSHLKKALRNRKRRRTHGAEKTVTPDFNRMVNHKRPGDSLTDPYDLHKLNQTDPFKESNLIDDPVTKFLERGATQQARMTGRLKSTLKSLDREISRSAPPRVITESDDEENMLEVDLEDVGIDRDEFDA